MEREEEIQDEFGGIMALSNGDQAGIMAFFIGSPLLAMGAEMLGWGEIGFVVAVVGAGALGLGGKFLLDKGGSPRFSIPIIEQFRTADWSALLGGPIEAEGGIVEGEVVKDEPMPSLPSLPNPDIPSAYDLLVSGSLGADILLGHDKAGKEIRRTWKQLKAILILGLQGGGKSTSACWLICQALGQGARLAVIDKHAKSEDDSLMQKIEPLSSFFDCPPGVDPASSLQVAMHVRRVFDARLDGAPCDYPLLLVVDEFSAIMRQITKKESKWYEAAVFLSDLIEELNFEGRKHKIYAVCMGQATNATRTGGTEIRDLFNSRIVHGMREKQVEMLSLTDYKKSIRALEAGQAIVDMEGRDEPFFVQVPYLSDEDIKAFAEFLRANSVTSSSLPSGEGNVADAIIAALAKLDRQDLMRIIEQMPDRRVDVEEDEDEPLSEQEQRYEDALRAWEGGAKSIRAMQRALGIKFNEARELLEEMDGLGLITWRNREETEGV